MKKILLILVLVALLCGTVSAGFTPLPNLIDTPSLVNIQDGTQIGNKDTSVLISADKQEFTANGITASALVMVDGKTVDKSKSLSTKEGDALVFTHEDGSKFKYEYGGDYLKESITLTEPKKIEFTLSSSAMSSASLQEDGSIVIKDIIGKEAIYILKPYVIDINGEKTDIKYTLKNGTIGFNTDFKEFKYPIVIDPTFSKLANVSTLPNGDAYDVEFSQDNNYMAVGSVASPCLFIYAKNLSNASNWTKLANPGTLPSSLFSVAFSQDNNYMSVGSSSSPYLLIYAKNLSDASNWTKLANPGTLPTGGVNGVSFSNDNNYMAVAHYISPYLTIYAKNLSDASNWTKLANVSTLPTGTGNGVAFSQDNNYMAVGHSSTPFGTIYVKNLSDASNWTKLPNLSPLPGGGISPPSDVAFQMIV